MSCGLFQTIIKNNASGKYTELKAWETCNEGIKPLHKRKLVSIVVKHCHNVCNKVVSNVKKRL